MYPLTDNGVTELVVEDGSDPPTRGRLKELPCNDDPLSSNVARGEHPLLGATAPGDHIGIEIWAIRMPSGSPSSRKMLMERGLILALLPSDRKLFFD